MNETYTYIAKAFHIFAINKIKPNNNMKKTFLLLISVLATLCVQAKHRPTLVYLIAGGSNTDSYVDTSLPDYILKNKYQHCYVSYGCGTHSGNGRFEPFGPRFYDRESPNSWAYDAVTYYFLDKSLNQDFYVIKESLSNTAINLKVKNSTKDMYWSADPKFIDSTTASDKEGKSLLKAFTDNIGACIDNKLSKQKGGYEIKAFIWHQGESDRSFGSEYYKNLKDVIEYVRQYLVKKTDNKKYAQLPVILGGFSHKSRQFVNSLEFSQIRLAEEGTNIRQIDVHDATLESDGIHFDAAGAELLGRKIYNELVTMGLAGKNARTVPYKQHAHRYFVGSHNAYMYADFPDNTKALARAVIALPGGGYDHLAITHEGTSWAKFFNDRRIAYFTLIYHMPNGNKSIPVSDTEAAIKMVRDSAAVWHINPRLIGIMGSSAGGHLATTVVTHADSTCRPNFQILFYPVVTFEKATHHGSKAHFLGKDENNSEMEHLYSNETQVRKDVTPPAIIILASDDHVVPPLTNGIAYYEALVKAGIPATLHCYPSGGHGFGFKPSFKYHDLLLEDLSSWLSSDTITSALLYGKTINVIGDSYVKNHKRPFTEAWNYLVAKKYHMTYRNYGRNVRCLVFDRSTEKWVKPVLDFYHEMNDTANYILVI